MQTTYPLSPTRLPSRTGYAPIFDPQSITPSPGCNKFLLYLPYLTL